MNSGRRDIPEKMLRELELEPKEDTSEPVYTVYTVYTDSKELPTPEAFPVSAMPAGCRQLINESAAAIGCPPEFIGLPMLAVLGSAIGNSRVLKLKEGWEEGAGIYAAVIADPGEKKTPAYKVAIGPATKRQAHLRDLYRDKEDEYKREARVYEVDKRQAAKDGQAAPEPPQPPVMSRTVVEDTTVEALAVVLNSTPRGVLALRDELAGWVRAMDQYKQGGKGADRQFWLSAWSGAYVAVDRKSRGEPLILTHPFVSVFGSIQPGVLSELGAGREDGLLDRFIFAYPETVRSRWSDAEISPGARDAYRQLYNALREKHMPEDDHGDPEPVRIHLAPDAKASLINAIDMHREEMEAPGFPTRLKGPWSKLEAYLARLCLILAMSRAAETGVADRVETEDVIGAHGLTQYLKNHTRRVYVGLYGADSLDRLAEDLAAFLKERGCYWRGQPSELHSQLKSSQKPGRADELSKMVRTIVDRTPMIHLDDGHEAIGRPDGKRTTRRYITLTLRNGVNGVNGVNSE
jgi:hypothetical protein